MSESYPERERRTWRMFSENGDYNPTLLARSLRSLSEVVVSTHYSGFDDREELISVGISKALEMLKDPRFNHDYNPRSYLYTCIRNEVGNHLRRGARATPIEPDPATFGSAGPRDDDAILGVEYERQHAAIIERLKSCGVLDDRYRDASRGAALYRAIL